uniref:putative F-box/FBD/LRR-repeat protein At1g78760 n=1 Tax=Fragaria vesca subsp. vesca TaxID=101020 RepID=UPI0005CA6EB0|nr:PREDICTED: putative F-box/FBD/LRR-repeat protein At1g78760 [Fragaria vesca subsp. vesca]
MSLEDYALAFQQQIRAFREKLDLESKSRASGEDRISELPNAVLCHILSFIPSTKDVVRTSVLSTRWKDIWAYVPNLYFKDDEFSSSADFMAFVDRVLLVRDSSAIQRFHLHFNNCHAKDFSRVNGWISTAVSCNVVEIDLSIDTAVRRNVEELDNPIDLEEDDVDELDYRIDLEEDDMLEYPIKEDDAMFELPISLLTCKTLKVLSLRSMIIINMPTSACNCFPRLEFLHIHFTVMNPRSTVCMDLFHFPVLEYLSIDGDLGFNLLDFSISAPELKTLRIDLYSSDDLHDMYNFSIDAPKLEKLDLHMGFLSNFNFKSTKSLVEAKIDLHMHHNEKYVKQESVDRATEFLAEFSMVKYLSFT